MKSHVFSLLDNFVFFCTYVIVRKIIYRWMNIIEVLFGVPDWSCVVEGTSRVRRLSMSLKTT